MQFLESWFSNELLPTLLKYKQQGAKEIPDFIKAARRDRETEILDYLIDIDAKEWREIKKYFNEIDESVSEKIAKVKVTKGIANAVGKNSSKYTCANCGMLIPSYKGRYPKVCPNCSQELSEEDLDSLGVANSNNINISKGMANSTKVIKYTCSDCGLKVPVYRGKYPMVCPSCGGNLISLEPDYTDLDINMEEFCPEIQELINKAIKVFGERKNIDILGGLGNILYLYIDGVKKGYRIKPNKNISEIVKKLQGLIHSNPEEALRYLNKNADLNENAIKEIIKFKPITIEERIAKNRVLDYYPEEKNKDFWDTTEGKKIKKEIEVYIKEHAKEISNRIISIYNETLLVINKQELLWNVKSISADEVTGAVAITINSKVEDIDITRLFIGLQNINNTAIRVNENKKDNEDYIIVVY